MGSAQYFQALAARCIPDIVNMRVAQASAAATLIICDIRGAKDDASRQVHDAN
jgi:hypothetical protein